MRAALILGAAVWPDGPSPTLRRRTLHAAMLWHRGEVEALVPCGGLGRHPPTEAEAMRALLLSEGIPDAAIHPEARSTTTWENVAFALPILARLGVTEAVIVTCATHAPRARLIARAQGLRARAAPLPLRGGRPSHTLRQALREVPATALVLWRIGSRARGQR